MDIQEEQQINSTPLVSVVIPTFNRASVIVRAIESAIAQTYKNLEIIVVDDHSEDNTVDILRQRYGERLRVVEHDRRQGAAAARNTGIRVSCGEYIAFLDSDDEWMPDKIAKQIELLSSSDRRVGLVYCGLIKAGGIEDKISYWPKVRGEVFSKQLYRDNILGTPTWLVRRSCFFDDRIGFFNEKATSREDYDFSLRLTKYYSVDYVNEILVLVHANLSNRITDDIECSMKGEIEAIKQVQDYIEKYSFILRRKILSSQYFWLAWKMNVYRQYKVADHYFKKSLKYWPLNIRTLTVILLIAIGDRDTKVLFSLWKSKAKLLEALRKRLLIRRRAGEKTLLYKDVRG